MTKGKDATGDSSSPGSGFFEKTLWSTILKAKGTDEAERNAALDRLLARYRRPLVLHIQHSQRCDLAKAEDLAHDFIHHWIRQEFLKKVAPERGRFRTFLKDCVRNFLIDHHRREGAEKRRRSEDLESLDDQTEDGVPRHQPVSDAKSAQWEMDQEWARIVLESALGALATECQAARRGSVFQALKPSLSGDADASTYASIAARLGISLENVKVTAHRLRKRLGELIRDEIAQTAGSREDCEEELRYLIELMGKA